MAAAVLNAVPRLCSKQSLSTDGNTSDGFGVHAVCVCVYACVCVWVGLWVCVGGVGGGCVSGFPFVGRLLI